MLRMISTALICLMVVATAADARTRIRVTKNITLRENPYAVNFILAAILCSFAMYSVPPGQQAGQCPPRADVTPYRRRV